jgi:hypothetical protein
MPHRSWRLHQVAKEAKTAAGLAKRGTLVLRAARLDAQLPATAQDALARVAEFLRHQDTDGSDIVNLTNTTNISENWPSCGAATVNHDGAERLAHARDNCARAEAAFGDDGSLSRGARKLAARPPESTMNDRAARSQTLRIRAAA